MDGRVTDGRVEYTEANIRLIELNFAYLNGEMIEKQKVVPLLLIGTCLMVIQQGM